VLGYGSGKIIKLYNKDDPTIISIDKVIDLSSTKNLNLTALGFDIMIIPLETDLS